MLIPCPTCGARDEEPCRTAKGAKANRPHATRERARFLVTTTPRVQPTAERTTAVHDKNDDNARSFFRNLGEPLQAFESHDNTCPICGTIWFTGSKDTPVFCPTPELHEPSRPWWWPFSRLAPIGSPWKKETL